MKHANFSAPELFGCFEDADDPVAEDPTRTQMSDVYAFGCLFYEVCFNEHRGAVPLLNRLDPF